MIENNDPQWKKIYIESKVPEKLASLEKLAYNLWWSWQPDAVALFESIDPQRWEEYAHNPIALLDHLNYEDFQRLEKNKEFMEKLEGISDRFNRYMSREKKYGPRVAYFCMEYGLHSSFKLYSGGLGVLAGDFLKEASDERVDMVGLGLLYRYGYFRQGLSMHGDQVAHYDPQRFTHLPLEPVRNNDGSWIKVQVALPERALTAKIWRANVGRVPLYLLDVDIEENRDEDKFITHQLYGGDKENRLKQEILLGIGGIRALEALGIQPDVYHLNEGHAAFIGVERLKNYMQEGLSYEEAVEVIRSSSLFTTHTPVPAGHDSFSEGMLLPYFSDYTGALNLSWERLMGLGRINPYDKHEEFSMSHLASRLSQEVNGVSRIHGGVSRNMLQPLYKGYEADELHISYVTNGVHYPTWTAREWQQLYQEVFGKKFLDHQSEEKYWEKIKKVPDAELIKVKRKLKRELLDALKIRIERNMRARYESPKKIVEILSHFSEDKLIFGFARRFATYKRAQLLFRNPERLASIVNNPECPVQFIFAGKAHPADKGGQGLIKHIYELSGSPEFLGKVIFLEDYDMDLASMMVKGVDVWLNTPTRPLEASGTSGIKATMNGVMNFSVLDGWWAEGFRPDAGWALPEERTYENQELQDELDAESIYSRLEHEIIPEYYNKNQEGVPEKWVARMKNAIANIAPHFTMKRMMDDYHDKFYNKLYERHQLMQEKNFSRAKELAAWKAKVMHTWNNIEVVEKDIYNFENDPLPLGEEFSASITLDIKDLEPEDISVELLIAERKQGRPHIVMAEEFNPQSVKSPMAAGVESGEEESGQLVKYICKKQMKLSGVYEYGFRIFPKNDLLPHRQDFSLVRWI